LTESTAVQRARDFAGAPVQVVLDVLNNQPLPADYTGPDHDSVDFGVVRGLTLDLPIESTLKERTGAVVEIVRVDEMDNPLYGQQVKEGRPAPRTVYAFTWREPPQGDFYRAISGNVPNLRAGTIMAKMLMRFSTVRARIVAFDTSFGQDGYTFAGEAAETAFGR